MPRMGDGLNIDFQSADAVRHPWPRVAEAQKVRQVFRNTAAGQWVVTTDRLCRRLLLDHENFSLRAITAPFFGSSAFIAIDEREAHDTLRGVWAVAFQRQTLDQLEPVITEIADDMLMVMVNQMRAGVKADAVGALCRDLPAHVIAYMLGVPSEVRPKIVEWSDQMGAGGGVPLEGRFESGVWSRSEEAKAQLEDYLFDHIE